jgi:hypothetical protein
MASDTKKSETTWILLILVLLALWYWLRQKKPAAPAAPAVAPTPAPSPSPAPVYDNPMSDPNNPPIFHTVGPDLASSGTDTFENPEAPGNNYGPVTGSSLTQEGFYTGSASWSPGEGLADATIAGLNTWQYIENNINMGVGLYDAYQNLQASGGDLTQVTDQINGAIQYYLDSHSWGDMAW